MFFELAVLVVLAVPVIGLVTVLVMWSRIARAQLEIDALSARQSDLERRSARAQLEIDALSARQSDLERHSAPASTGAVRRTPVPAPPGPSVPTSRPPVQPKTVSPRQSVTPPSAPRPVPAQAMTTPLERPTAPRTASVSPMSSATGGASDVIRWLGGWLVGGNSLVRVGVVVLLFGVAFFLNFAIDQGWLPVEVRLMLAAAGGLALTSVGWRLRDRSRDYALVLQGGGIGIVYLTVFAAVNLYDLVDAGPGLALLVVLVALSSALAVLQDAPSLAILATLAGFLAPVVISSDGSHVGLFSYYAVLNVGVLAIAWFKIWRLLNLLGFTFTFIISAAWGAQYYQPEYFASTEPFLVAFFLFYVAVPVLFATRQATPEARWVDGSLLFGVPLVAFGLQAGLVKNVEYGLAFSALSAGLFYVAMATALWRRVPEAARILTEAFVMLAVAFGTLTIPLTIDGRWTGGAWAFEGAGLIWIGIRQRRWLARASGIVLQLMAGASFMMAPTLPAGDIPVFNSVYLGALFVSLAGFFSAWYLDQHRTQWNQFGPDLSAALLGWGLLWWVGAGADQISLYVPRVDRLSAYLTFAAVSSLALGVLRTRLKWRHLSLPVLLYLPVMASIALGSFADEIHPFVRWGGVAWCTALAAHYWLQYHLESEWPDGLARAWHAGMLWLIVFLGSREVAWVMGQLAGGGTTWGTVAWAIVPGAAVVIVPLVAERLTWPLAAFAEAYLRALTPVVAFLAGWVLFASIERGDPAPLPYVPLVNPLELVQCLVVAIIVRWRSPGVKDIGIRNRCALHSMLAFVVLNGIIARASHFIGGVDFDFPALWLSARYQTVVSIVWTAAAIAAMLAARWLTQRIVWFAGAALLAAVVVKLFLVDLDGVGTVARMISFVVVGLLILLVGYLSPLPPTTKEQTQS